MAKPYKYVSKNDEVVPKKVEEWKPVHFVLWGFEKILIEEAALFEVCFVMLFCYLVMLFCYVVMLYRYAIICCTSYICT